MRLLCAMANGLIWHTSLAAPLAFVPSFAPTTGTAAPTSKSASSTPPYNNTGDLIQTPSFRPSARPSFWPTTQPSSTLASTSQPTHEASMDQLEFWFATSAAVGILAMVSCAVSSRLRDRDATSPWWSSGA